MRRLMLGTLAALTLLISACDTPPTRERGGMVLGGILGGVVGSEIGDGGTAATVIGVLAGAAIGGALGRQMDEQDRRHVAAGLERGRSGEPRRWVNPDSGVRYEFTPTRTYRQRGGPCREYVIDASVGGRPDRVYGTACRQPDGSWQVQP